MEATLVGGAAVRAVFGQLLSAVVRMKDKAIMFKQTLADLQSTLEALDPVIKEMEQQNNDLDRPKKELERLIREMEKGTKLVLTCSKIHRLNYLARVRRQDELVALLTSLVRFCLVEMQAQTARDQKETLIKVTRILSRVNKMPVVSTEDAKDSSLDSVHVPLNVSGSEIYDSPTTCPGENELGTDPAAEQIMETTTGSCSDSDPGLIDVSESRIDDSAVTNRNTENEAGTNSSDQIMESIEADQSKEKADNNKTTEHSMGEKSCDDQLGTAEKRFLGLRLRKIKRILPRISGPNTPVNKATLEPPDPVQCTESVNCSKQNATSYTKVADETSYSDKNLFYDERVHKMVHFEGYYNFDLEDLLRASAEVIGKGSYGTTYKAILENGTTVVVKRLREVLVGKREFEQQLEIVHRHTRHPNVIPLCAYYYYTDEKLLVYDYIAAGCFSRLLHGSRGTVRNPVDWNSRLKISLGAARGISHIHSSSGSQFVHGNVKSSNILITADLEGCISDFGLISLVNPFRNPSPNGYRAPEVFETGTFTQKSDVYSFGVLLLEMLTGETPVQYSPEDRVVDLPKWVESVIQEECTEEVFDVELQRHRNAKEDMVRLLHLAMTCVARVPDMRPSMEEVVEKIEEIVRAETARDQKETLLKATEIPSRVSTEDAMNSTLDSVPVPVDMSGSEIHDSKATHPAENELGTNSAAEQVMSSCLDSDPVPVDVSQSRIDESATTQTTENAARTNSAEQSKEKADNNKTTEHVNGKIAHFEDYSLNFDLEDLLRASYEVLGNGSHGLTYKVRLENETTLVVKRLKEVDQLVAGEKEFEQQLEIVHSLTQHPNVIPLCAYYYTRDIKLLIYDYIAAGSFSRLLHENPVDWDFRLKISLGAARGIAHIHSASGSQFVHGNIKSSNVLITLDLEGCISDFGLISLVNPFVHPSQDGYRAPEVFETGTLTQKSDVYSFGVLLLEMLTGKTPVQYYPWQEPVVDLPEWVESVVQERWTDEVFDGVRLRYRDVKEDMVLMLKLAMICVTKVPDMRPSMQEVVEMIEEIIRASNGF